jgi:predicted dehydrogenase
MRCSALSTITAGFNPDTAGAIIVKQHERLKVAMIGVGDITDLHHPAYVDFDLAELYMLCDTNPEQLEGRAKQWGVHRITTDYIEVLQDPEVDIVEINTPHHLHKKLTVEALEAGKHVACQKPMAVTISECEAMIEAEQTNPGRFRVMENFVFYPPYVKARELIQNNEIGEPLTIRFKLGSGLFGSSFIPTKDVKPVRLRSELWHLMEVEKGMGQSVFDDGYHKCSVAIWLFGQVQSVLGFIGRSFGYIDEPGQLIWRYRDSRIIGSFDLAFSPNLYTCSPYFPADERIEIIGAKGMINLTGCTGRLTDDAPLILYRDGKTTLFEDLSCDWRDSFVNGIREFPRGIAEDRPVDLTAERGTDVLRLAYAFILAAHTRIEVRPDELTDDMIVQTLGLEERT